MIGSLLVNSVYRLILQIQVGGEWLEEKCFVGAHMKAVLMFTYAEFSGIRIGAANETLWTEVKSLAQ